jgi:hypothetical protein
LYLGQVATRINLIREKEGIEMSKHDATMTAIMSVGEALGVKYSNAAGSKSSTRRTVHIDDLDADSLANLGVNVRRN